MTPADVGKIEAGRLVAYPGQARKLARALGFDVTEGNCLFETVSVEAVGGDGRHERGQ